MAVKQILCLLFQYKLKGLEFFQTKVCSNVMDDDPPFFRSMQAVFIRHRQLFEFYDADK